MTTNVTVSVNGNYKVPVRVESGDSDVTTVLSGRGHDGPKVETFGVTHGTGCVITIGPEEPDAGDAEA